MYECAHSGTDIPSGYQLEKRDIHTYQPRLDETEKASLLLEGCGRRLTRRLRAHFLFGCQVQAERQGSG